MKAIIALSLFIILSSCTQRDGKGGAQGEDEPASDSESGTNPSGSGTPTSNPDEENYGSKKDKDVETGGSTTPDAETVSPPDPATPATITLDSDIDGVTDDKDVCPGADDALQSTRYKLTDADNDSYADGSLSALVCPSNTEYTLTLPEVIYTDCDGADGSKWQMLSYAHRDADGDGHSIVSAGSLCSGNALPAGYLTSALGTTDCNDANGSYHTVATYYSYPADNTTTDRYTRTSESKCVPSDGFGLVNAYKEYRLAPEIISASGLSSVNGFYEFAGKAYFRASSSSYGNELWSTDGTLAGATMIKDINAGTANSSPSNFIKVGSTLYFTAYDGSGPHLWKTDGTEAGTIKVKAGITPSLLTDVNGTLYFVATDGSGTELWKSDGTEAGTVMIKDINPGSDSNPTSLTNLNGTLLFAADDGTHGIELWKSDGTEAGTVLVKDIDTDLDSSPTDFLVVGGTLFFTATLNSSGRELWKSNGTEAGTSMVKDINPGGSSSLGGSGTSYFTAANSTLFFRADNGSSGLELWKSDGTEAGTILVKDIRSGSTGSSPSTLIAVNGTLFFSADNGTQGSELWKSDGTEAGTVLVKDVNSGTGSASMVAPIAVGSILYYRTDDGTHNSEVWKSDGTEAGTILVKDINNNGSSNPQSLSAYSDRLIFVAIPPEGARIHISTSPL